MLQLLSSARAGQRHARSFVPCVRRLLSAGANTSPSACASASTPSGGGSSSANSSADAALPRPKLSPSKSGVYEEYMRLVNSNKLQYDEHQYKIIKTLERVQQLVVASVAPSEHDEEGGKGRELDIKIPRGVYIYGEVGTGKTMMMDLFLKSTNLTKKRVHFHKFMLQVHQIIHHYKQDLLRQYGREKNLNLDPSRDPILHCARVIRESAQLLCFDEFQVTDIADAIIMTKLFGELWKQGVILVATSNRPPANLYQGGLNRSYFLPFIEELEYRCIVRHLKSPVDYRKLLSTKLPNAYLTPINEETTKQLYEMFLADSSSQAGTAILISVPVMMGRQLSVLARDRVCYVTFQDMCEDNRGAADYSALARHMDVIYLEGIPVLSVITHDRARRFITFVDEIYDAGKRLVWSSAVEPQNLFQFLTPTAMKDADFGTDHSWANLEAVRGESGGQLGGGAEPLHQIRSSTPRGVEQFEKDGGIVSMRFQEASKATEVSFEQNQENDEGGSEEREVKLLEGELASIQELSFAFKRAGSRLAEISSRAYLEAAQEAAAAENKGGASTS